MSLFKNRFNTILEQQTKETEEATPSPEEALKAELDPGTDPAALGASVPATYNPDQDIQAAKSAALQNQKNEIQSWINQIQQFVTFLNDPTPESVQTKLHDAGCDTLFEKIASSEHKRIARIAVELSGLIQSLNGFLIAGED
jgi:hypothetical protein